MNLSGDSYELVLSDPSNDVEMALTLSANVHPSMTPRTGFGDSNSWIRWLVVPKLCASGTIRHKQSTIRINRAVAYHDHNWGAFAWGGDFSWIWASILPVDPAERWSIVLSQVLDGRGNVRFSQSLPVWYEDALWRSFEGEQVTVFELLTTTKVAKKLPAVAGSLTPPETSCAQLARICASDAENQLNISLGKGSFAQILIPSSRDVQSFATITECFTDAVVELELASSSIRFNAKCIVEQTRNHSVS